MARGTTLTGFGGLGEIGGNAFLLDDGKTRLLLDVGKRFGHDALVEERGMRPGWNDYWDEFLRPRTFRYVRDLLTLDLIPPIEGLYREDLGGAPGNGVDAIVVSHAHMDHVGLLGLARWDIPVWTSAASRAILASVAETTSSGGPEAHFAEARATTSLGLKKDGDLTNSPRYEGQPRAFDTAGATQVGDWRVEHLPVDHSIHGARAAVVSGPGATLAYTGDYRMHGRNRQATEKFVERAGDVDYLLTEGTRIRRPGDREAPSAETDEEQDVEQAIERFIAEEDRRGGSGFVGIAYPPRDLDRLLSILHVARRTGRTLVITTKQAHLLESLRRDAGREDLPDPRTDPRIAVHLRAKKAGTVVRAEGNRVWYLDPQLRVRQRIVELPRLAELMAQDYDGWERKYVEYGNSTTSAKVRREPQAFLFSINYWSIADLFDVFPDPGKGDGLYIHSATQPFNDDMEQNDRKLMRWLKRFGLRRVDTHVSGHLGQKELDWVIDEIKPKVVVPIHTMATEYTADRYTARTQCKAVLLSPGAPVRL